MISPILPLLLTLYVAEPHIISETLSLPKLECKFDSARSVIHNNETGVWLNTIEAECLLHLVEERIPLLGRSLTLYRDLTTAQRNALETAVLVNATANDTIRTQSRLIKDLRETKDLPWFREPWFVGSSAFILGVAATLGVVYAVVKIQQ